MPSVVEGHAMDFDARDDERDLIDEIADEGFEDREHAAHALRATVAMLREHLGHDGARLLARIVPDELRDEGDDAPVIKEELSSGRAREEAQIVCAALARRLDDDERGAIARALPDAVAEDFRHALRAPAPPMPGRPAPNDARFGRTLATGRPGSRRPVSEASAERAHAESVARSAEPHADTKLSSARGLTQEREDESMASARRP